MANQNDVKIDENKCQGCGYCELFCPNNCFSLTDRYNSKGFIVPIIISKENCTGCGICDRMCPAMAIEIYQCVTEICK